MSAPVVPMVDVRLRAPYHPPIEVVERKGQGHPDTLCDHLAEWVSRRLSNACMARTGSVQHHNVDKGLLVAGRVELGYGSGRHLQPAHLTIAGRADLGSSGLDRDEIVAGMRSELAALVPDADRDAFTVDLRIEPPSAELAPLTAASERSVPLANDTSFAVVSLPRSPLEELVHVIGVRLNSLEFRQAVPIGPDVKVMGLRRGDHIELTVSAAVLARRVASAREYRDAVSAVRDDVSLLATRHGERSVAVAVNHAGDDLPYLTLSGSSAEAGDDGEVGRGNRFGGLITPYRPTSNEACAGKNPVSHVGKTYHCVAHDIARRLLADTSATEATVGLLSRIGDPVTQPAVVHVETVGAVDPADVRAVAEACLADWRGVRDRLLAGQYELF